MFGDDQIRFRFDLLLFVAIKVTGFPPEQRDQIGNLFDGPGFAQIAQVRFFLRRASSRIRIPVELGQNEDGNLKLLGQRLDSARDFRDFHLTVVLAAA